MLVQTCPLLSELDKMFGELIWLQFYVDTVDPGECFCNYEHMSVFLRLIAHFQTCRFSVFHG